MEKLANLNDVLFPLDRVPQPAQHGRRRAVLPGRENGQGGGRARHGEARGGAQGLRHPGQAQLQLPHIGRQVCLYFVLSNVHFVRDVYRPIKFVKVLVKLTHFDIIKELL